MRNKLYHQLSLLRDRSIPDVLVEIIDFIRDLLWEEEMGDL